MKNWLIIQSVALKLLGILLLIFTDFTFLGWTVFFSAGAVVFALILLPRTDAICSTYCRFKTSMPEVWLTIDDGPDPETTPFILELLERYEAKATFFLIGRKASLFPDLVGKIHAHGHQIGNHTLTHPLKFFWLASFSKTKREIVGTQRILEREGPPPLWFRTPAGIKNIWQARILRDNSLKFLTWTIRSRDTLGGNPSRIARRIARQAHPGAIILMHDQASNARPEGPLAKTLQDLSKAGYRFVVPSEAAVLCQPSAWEHLSPPRWKRVARQAVNGR